MSTTRGMATTGTFSYKNDNIYRRTMGHDYNYDMVIEKMDANIAKIRFENTGDHSPLAIPQGINVVMADTMMPAARVGNEFFIITWFGNYLMLAEDGAAIFKILNQQSQNILPVA